MAQQQETTKSKHEINRLTSFGDDGIEIINNDTYMIIDLPIKDRLGIVRETVSRTVLYPNKVTKGHRHDNHVEHYHFQKGTGLIILHGPDWNEIREIQPESYCFIEKGTWHQVINTSKNEDMEFTTIFPGPSERPHLDIENGKANNTATTKKKK